MSDKELELLKGIADNRQLPEGYDRAKMTPLMHIAYATYAPFRAFREMERGEWTKRLGRMAVAYDFRNIEKVPEEYRSLYAGEFANCSSKLRREDIDDYSRLMNQDPAFTYSVVKHKNGLLRFVDEHNELSTWKTKEKIRNKVEPTKKFADERMDFSSAGLANPDEQDAETFLSLPVEEQTIERLDALLDSDVDLPMDFIKRLQTPHRNEHFYKQHGDAEQAAFWAARKIPYLNLDVCKAIALSHPESSVMTPPYLTEDGVISFWENKREQGLPKAKMSEYFMMFPEKLLKKDMLDDLQINWQVLAHAPSLLLGSEYARLYLNRHPGDILRLPEAYQEERRLIADGVNYTPAKLQYIKNDLEREKIKIAFNL